VKTQLPNQAPPTTRLRQFDATLNHQDAPRRLAAGTGGVASAWLPSGSRSNGCAQCFPKQSGVLQRKIFDTLLRSDSPRGPEGWWVYVLACGDLSALLELSDDIGGTIPIGLA
jgi:hypothetical protein